MARLMSGRLRNPAQISSRTHPAFITIEAGDFYAGIRR